MLKIAVLVLLCAVSINASCTTLQRLKVKSQWSAAFGTGTDREAFGTALWKAWVNIHGRLQHLLNQLEWKNATWSGRMGGSGANLSIVKSTSSIGVRHPDVCEIQHEVTQVFYVLKGHLYKCRYIVFLQSLRPGSRCPRPVQARERRWRHLTRLPGSLLQGVVWSWPVHLSSGWPGYFGCSAGTFERTAWREAYPLQLLQREYLLYSGI